MADNHKNIIKSNAEYTRSYRNMRGVSYESGREDEKFGELINMYVDYERGGEFVESIPGFRLIASLDGCVHAMYRHPTGDDTEYLVVHSGNKLYRLSIEDRDSIGIPKPIAEISDEKSHGFIFGNELYVLDGSAIIRINRDGEVKKIGTEDAYVPTTFKDGVRSEDRSILTNAFCQSYGLLEPALFIHGTRQLTYRITDHQQKRCAVSGLAGGFSGELHIPAYTRIGDETYRVSEIDDGVFMYNKSITSVITGPSLTRIGTHAFANCPNLARAYISDTVTELGERAFFNCTRLEELYVGLNVKSIGKEAFLQCDAIESVSYPTDPKRLREIDKEGELEGKTLSEVPPFRRVRLSFPLFGEVASVSQVELDGEACEFSYDPLSREVTLECASFSDVYLTEVKIFGQLSDTALTPTDPIAGCRVSAVFDGRVFLSGNPRLPGRVFYSQRREEGDDTPLYFTEERSFTDGVGGWGVISMLSTADLLYVFMSGDGGEGSVFCHTERDGKYPSVYSHGGIGVIGPAHNLADDALFLTDLGVCALEKVSGSDFREVVTRSGAINPRLLSELTENCVMSEWRGYLLLLCEGRAYLADSRGKVKRDGSFEYEWYPLEGIGTYRNDRPVYRYSSVATSPTTAVKPMPDEVADGVVMSRLDGNLNHVLYVTENGVDYEVYGDGERCGGDYYPATVALGIGELLFFGTSVGDVCVFNNDRLDLEERGTYTFMLHAAKYLAATALDTCGIPYLKKSTVRSSCVARLKAIGGGRVGVSVIADSESEREIGEGDLDTFSFDRIDFSSFSFSGDGNMTLTIPDGVQNFVSKRLIFSSKRYSSPFGIKDIYYRYRIKGRILPK